MTPTQFKARYPEFSTTLDATIQLVIDDAAPWFDVPRWGDFYDQGVAAWVAHTLTVNKKPTTGASGAVSGKSVGDVSVNYAAPQLRAADAFYASTAYGVRYMQLRRLVGMGALAV